MIDAVAVARRLGRSRSWFYAHRKALETAGFPQPLRIVARWDPTAIDAWIAGQGRVTAAVRKDEAKETRRTAFGR